MADRAKKITELNAHSSPAANNLLVIVNHPGQANAETMKITLSNLFGSMAANVNMNGNALILANTAAPANSSSTGIKGEIRVDTSYIYICTATNTWKRATLSTW